MAETTAVATRGPTPGICCKASADFILARDLLHIFVQTLDLQLQMFPLLPKKIQQAAHASAELLLCVLQDLRHLRTQAGRPFTKADPPLQQEIADLIDYTSPPGYQPL